MLIGDVMNQIDHMEGQDFEYFCAELLRRSGYSRVKVTPRSGDKGVDIIAIKNGVKYGFQCKRFQGTVGNHAVSEVYSGVAYYKLDKAVVITNSGYTPSAIDAAKRLGVVLLGREDLIDLIKNSGMCSQSECRQAGEAPSSQIIISYRKTARTLRRIKNKKKRRIFSILTAVILILILIYIYLNSDSVYFVFIKQQILAFYSVVKTIFQYILNLRLF